MPGDQKYTVEITFAPLGPRAGLPPIKEDFWAPPDYRSMTEKAADVLSRHHTNSDPADMVTIWDASGKRVGVTSPLDSFKRTPR